MSIAPWWCGITARMKSTSALPVNCAPIPACIWSFTARYAVVEGLSLAGRWRASRARVTSARTGLHRFTDGTTTFFWTAIRPAATHDGARNEQEAELVDLHEKTP